MKKILFVIALLSLSTLSTAQGQWAHKAFPVVTSWYDTLGITDTSVTPHTLMQIDIPGNTWNDGDIIELHFIQQTITDTGWAGDVVTSIAINDSQTFTMDSTTFDNYKADPAFTPFTEVYVVDFYRVKNQIWYCPSPGNQTSTPPPCSLIGNGLGNFANSYSTDAFLPFGANGSANPSNGNRFSADFTAPIRITFQTNVTVAASQSGGSISIPSAGVWDIQRQ